MWSETVGLRKDRSVTKKIGLGLGLAGLCCHVVKHYLNCHALRHNDLEGHNNFSSTVYSFSILCWNITIVEINSGVHLLKS